MISSRFERMAVIPEREYTYLKSLQQVNNPTQEKISNLSNDYTRQGLIKDPYTRVHRQAETLDQIRRLKDDIQKQILQSTPKPYQTRAKSLMSFLENQLEVNDRGELIGDNHVTVSDSNITDLIQHAVRDRRRNIQPEGWEVFKEKLQNLNVPQSFLNYDTLDEIKRPLRIKQSPDSFKTSNTNKFSPSSSPFKRRTIQTRVKRRETQLQKKNSPQARQPKERKSKYVATQKLQQNKYI